MTTLLKFFICAIIICPSICTQPLSAQIIDNTSKYGNGQLKYSGAYKKGMKSGKWTSWSETGKKIEEVNYFKDKKNGAISKWYENGNIALKGYYKMGAKHGDFNTYFENGNLKSQGKYKNGVREGVWSLNTHHSASKGAFVRGQKDGCWITKNSSGQLVLAQGKFNQGKEIGEWNYYDDQNKIKITCLFDQGSKHGLYTAKFESDQTYETGYYNEGYKDGQWCRFFENGDTAHIENWSNGAFFGLQKYYHPNKQIKESVIYNKYWDARGCSPCSKKDSIYLEWYDDGQIAVQGYYSHGLKNGEWQSFYKNGDLKTRENWVIFEEKSVVRNIKDGVQSYFAPGGDIIREETYKDGLLINSDN